MANLVRTIRAPQLSILELRQMLAWLMSVAGNESESLATRKNACVASLSMAELLEVGGNTNQHFGVCLSCFRDSERLCRVVRNLANEKSV